MRSKFKWIFTLLLAFSMQFSFAQEKTVTGVVSDDKGTLPGANVVVKGTARGVQTDMDGKYAIKVKQGETLVFSFIGMKDVEKVVGASNTVSVKMEPTTSVLQEVVVEGYRTTTKAATVVAQTTVNAKTIENRPNASFIQTLQGQVAGLNIQTGSGQPGAKSTVIIRGVGTINANTDPLYVIDGMPTNGDNFRSLNPNDIESATVLKDASAIAIYGNRGSNGVIVVKTRKGGTEQGKTKFRYSLNTGFTSLQGNDYSLANAKELLTLERTYGVGRGNLNPATGVPFTDAEINAYPIDTDWVDYFFDTAASSEHNFSVESQGKSLSSYTSLNYLDQEGILKSTGLKRFTLRNNLNGKSENEKFFYSTNLSLGFSKNNEATNLGTGAINRNYVLGATLSAPYISPDEYIDPVQVFDLYQADGTLLYTPLFLMDKLATYTNQTDELRLIGSLEAGYEIFKNLTFKSRTGIESIQNRFTQSEHPISFNALLFVNPGQEFGGFEDVNNRRETYFNQLWQLDYTRKFAEKHTVRLLAATEYNFNQLNSNNVRQRGLNPSTFVPGTGSGYLADITAHDFYGPQASVGKLKRNLLSYFGTLDYDFNNKYGIVGSFRRDGTSAFIGDRVWGEFWSVGARWNIDNEAFLKDSKIFKVLKMRGSYGTVGNQRIVDGTVFAGLNPPPYINTLGVSAAAANVYNGQAISTLTLGYDDLHWETTEQSNVGLDFELFNKSRLRGTFDWYNRNTIEVFNPDPISPIAGATTLNRNSKANVRNKGVELSLAFDVVNNENFKFTLRGNGSYNDNSVDGLILNDGRTIQGNYITANGGRVYEFYVIPYAGVNPANGELLFQAADGTLTENPVDADRVATGKSEIPVYQGGFGFDIDYKGFFATSNFSFSQKVWRFDFDLDGFYDPTSLGQFVVSNDLLNAWTPTNTNTDVPALNALNLGTAANSDRFIQDASFVRLRYLQVGYRIPKKFLDKTFISGLSFYAQGENIYTWTKWRGFDAESDRAADQAQYPTPRIISFGMDLRF
ncbi:SusC/RagA family TonB-linked outer membrane protein [Flavobacterium sp.]|uniref:SusC/RagA family TonB-linked outer membrane protein n=1 Tax=Flavobacterium sp. TaxID=239 RepID=UPI002B4AEDF4|nr:SusC/RagA family TonB-linked outer membrane protein [Flavobacterium sp.]HLP64499.1 SusC/RagA family TonB-linked outer membrane protein [Flavobacterium sp.]